MPNVVDKNKAVINFLATYPDIQKSPLFVNFINASNDTIQFLTSSNDKRLNKPFIDGSVMKRYTFSLVISKSITDMAIAKDVLTNENLDDLADIQAMMDWINQQGEDHNYPDFGEECVIEEMHTTAENPSVDGINTAITPALCLYSLEIGIDYMDYSKAIWS